MVVSVVASRPACGVCSVYRSAMAVSPSVVVLRFTFRPIYFSDSFAKILPHADCR